MARALRWTIPFISMNGISCVINIYAEGWTGGVTELSINNPSTPGYASTDPFYYEELDNKDVLLPIRYSTGYINLVEKENGGLDDIFPTDILDRYVTLLYGGVIAWRGYIQQKEFSNRFGGNSQVRQFPIISALGLAGEIYFPNYDPPHAVTLRELMYTALQRMNVDYNVVMPMTGAGLDATISSLSICPFNAEHSFARENTEPVFAPQTLEYFIEGVCNLYGYTVREVDGILLFTAFNYDGQYMIYPYTPVGLSARASVELYGNTIRAITDFFTYSDNQGKLTRIESLKRVEYEFEGQTSYESDHDFNTDTYADLQNRGNTSYVYLQPYSESFDSSMLQTTADNTSYWPRTGISVLVYNQYGEGIDHNIIYGYSDQHGSVLFQQGFLCTRVGTHIMRLHVEWGYPPEMNNDELDNDINLSLLITIKNSYNTQPLYYLRRNHTNFYWDTSGDTLSIKIDKASGDIKVDSDQAFGFIPIPPTPSPYQNVYVTVYSYNKENISQKAFYSFHFTMEQSYINDLMYAIYPDLMKKVFRIGENGDTKNVKQNFSESIYAANRVVSNEYSFSTITPTVLATPQTRLTAKFRITGTSYLINMVTYIVKHTYWMTGWRWRIIAVRFYPWDDEYTLVLHRSSSI